MGKLAVIVLSVVSVTCSTALASDMYLDVDDIQGEVKDAHYRDWIEVSSFNISVTQPQPIYGGGGGGAGIPNFSPFSLTGPSSVASPELMGLVVTGAHVDYVQLDILPTGGAFRGTPIARWRLDDVFAASYRTSKNDAGKPIDEYSFWFQQIEYTYYELDIETGGVVGQTTFSWDLTRNATTSFTTGTVENFSFIVPEPTGAALAGLGSLGLLIRRRS